VHSEVEEVSYHSDKIPWIKSKTSKANAIIRLLEGFVKEKRNWNLDGSRRQYDFISGCYGNPNSKTLFVAEIPSFSGCKVVERLYPREMRWKGAWKTSTGDLIYRICLHDHRLIKPDPLSDKPWTWDCWLTDFVKCPHTDSEWKRMNEDDKEHILKESAKILQRELEIIAPENVIIVGKSKTKPLFKKYMRTWLVKNGVGKSGQPKWSWIDKNGEPKWVLPHYARAKSPDPESEKFVERFNYTMRQISKGTR
jgi:hypothetical protein